MVKTIATATLLAAQLLSTAAFAADPLSVMSFGGAYQEAQRKAVFESYTAKTGRPVSEQVPSTSTPPGASRPCIIAQISGTSSSRY